MSAPRLTPETAARKALRDALHAPSYEDDMAAAARDLAARADFREQVCAEDVDAPRAVALSPEYARQLAAMLAHAVREMDRLHRLTTTPEDRR